MCPKTLRSAFAPYLQPVAPGTEIENARHLPLAVIDPNPDQPRRLADAERLAELAADIADRGVLEPLIVRPVGDRYQVIAGGRRRAAAGIAGLDSVPCLIRDDLTDAEARAIALVENLQREDLDIEDEARALAELYQQGRSLREIGALIHKSYKYVQRRLRLVADPAALEAYRAGEMGLEDLVSDRSGPVPDVPMAEIAQAAQEAAQEVLQGSDFVTQRHSSGAGPVLDEARAQVHQTVIKPFHKMILHVRRNPPTKIPPDERDRLKRTVGDLIDELTEYYKRLDDAEESADDVT
jgi:ParB/RepB/Spo0J family partition protein